MWMLPNYIFLCLLYHLLYFCSGGRKGWYGSNSSWRRQVWPWCVLDCCTKSSALLRMPCLPSTHAICWHYRWDNSAQGHANTYFKKVKCEQIIKLMSTGTFKIQKMRLQREGYKPQDSSEKIYFLNSRAGCYEAVTDELYHDVVEGKVRLWGEGWGEDIDCWGTQYVSFKGEREKKTQGCTFKDLKTSYIKTM